MGPIVPRGDCSGLGQGRQGGPDRAGPAGRGERPTGPGGRGQERRWDGRAGWAPRVYAGSMPENASAHGPADEQIRLRAALDALPAYVPGRPAPDDGVHRFKVSSNESPFPPLPAVQQAVARAMETSHLYPDMGAVQLREAIAAHHRESGFDLAPEAIVLGTGSVAVTGDLVRALVDAGEEVVFAWRSFEAYPIVVGSHGGVSVPVPLTSTFEHDLDAMAAAITARTKLVILCTPNNPTGPALSTEEISEFLQKVPAHVAVAIDEAYREFVDPELRPDTARLFAEHPNVVILRTFSKLQGLAGLRLGYAIAHPRLARALGQVTVPFGASSLGQAAALATFAPDAARELEERAAWIRAERARVQEGLARIAGAARAGGGTGASGADARGEADAVGAADALPASQGNFVFFPLGERSGEFAAFADARGLVVRAYGADGVRVTIGEAAANDRLLEIAAAWVESGRDLG